MALFDASDEDGNQGKMFVWYREPPPCSRFHELCRDNFYHFNDQVCVPPEQLRFRLDHNNRLAAAVERQQKLLASLTRRRRQQQQQELQRQLECRQKSREEAEEEDEKKDEEEEENEEAEEEDEKNDEDSSSSSASMTTTDGQRTAGVMDQRQDFTPLLKADASTYYSLQQMSSSSSSSSCSSSSSSSFSSSFSSASASSSSSLSSLKKRKTLETDLQHSSSSSALPPPPPSSSSYSSASSSTSKKPKTTTSLQQQNEEQQQQEETYEIIDLSQMNISTFQHFQQSLLSSSASSYSIEQPCLDNSSPSCVALGALFEDGSSNFSPDNKNKNKSKKQGVEKKIKGFGLLWKQQLYFIPFSSSTMKERRTVMAAFLLAVLNSSHLQKVCYDLQQLLRALYSSSESKMTKPTAVYDPKIAAWLLDPDEGADEEFGAAYAYERLFAGYASSSDITTQSSSSFWKALKTVNLIMSSLFSSLQRNRLDSAFLQQEMLMPHVLCQMELGGILLEVSALTQYKAALMERAAVLEQKAEEWAEEKFLLSSSKQVSHILYDKLQLPKPKNNNNSKHDYATGAACLRELTKLHPLPSIILEHRHISKLLSSYIDPFAQRATHEADEFLRRKGLFRVRCTWSQTKAATGRLSSADPNLQNLPRTEDLTFFVGGANGNEEVQQKSLNLNIKDAFVCEEDCVFLAADYSQLEMRILAHCCKDEALLGFLRSGEDIFTVLASRWWPKSSNPEQEREVTKKICYGIIYGKGAAALASELQVNEDQARRFLDRFLQSFPRIKHFIDETKEQTRKTGNVRTLLSNRWRLLPAIVPSSYPAASPSSSSSASVSQAERQCLNTLIQGTASDIVKRAMLQVEKEIANTQQGKERARIVMQVHDELILEVKKEAVDWMQEVLRRCMEGAVRLEVPLPVRMKIGTRLGSLRPVDEGERDKETEKEKAEGATEESGMGPSFSSPFSAGITFSRPTKASPHNEAPTTEAQRAVSTSSPSSSSSSSITTIYTSPFSNDVSVESNSTIQPSIAVPSSSSSFSPFPSSTSHSPNPTFAPFGTTTSTPFTTSPSSFSSFSGAFPSSSSSSSFSTFIPQNLPPQPQFTSLTEEEKEEEIIEQERPVIEERASTFVEEESVEEDSEALFACFDLDAMEREMHES